MKARLIGFIYVYDRGNDDTNLCCRVAVTEYNSLSEWTHVVAPRSHYLAKSEQSI